MRHLATLPALAIALAATGARAGDLSPSTEFPVGDEYRVTLRFEIDQIVPEVAGTRTRVDFDGAINIRLIDISEDNVPTLRFQMDRMSIKYEQAASVTVVGFRFDSERGEEYNGDAESLKEFIGQLVEFRFTEDLTDDNLLDAIKLMFPRDDPGNFFRMFLSERLFSQSLPYIFGFAGDADAVQVGDSFDTVLKGRLISEATVHFDPVGTYTETDGALARLVFDGDPTVTDRRTKLEINDGNPNFVLVSSTVAGEATWNTEDHLLEALDLTAEAFLEPDEIDPLGRRIERRRLLYRIQAQRIAPAQ